MATVTSVSPVVVRPPRRRYLDTLKVVLVCGVIVGHVTMSWTGIGNWVFEEPHVRDPLFSVLVLAGVIGALFAMPAFFLVAGLLTPPSLERKGWHRFVTDRLLRLGLPMMFFMLVLSPLVEYADPGNAGWDRGFWAFVPHVWWPPVPGPTWFLGVLLVFSVGYAAVRTLRPRRATHPTGVRARELAAVAGLIAATSYVVRLSVPLGVEVWRLALGQCPAWVAGFVLGVVGGERGWLDHLSDRSTRSITRAAWAGLVTTALFIGWAVGTGAPIEAFAGGGTWQSFVLAALEGTLVVTVPLWLITVFRRRFDRQGPLGRTMARSAYAAFVLHQVVLVGLVLLTRQVGLPPEIEFVSVAVLGVGISFAVASIVIRVPGLSRLV